MHRWVLWTGMQRLDNHGRLGDVDSDYTGYADYAQAFDSMLDCLRCCRDDGDYEEAMIFEPMGAGSSGLWTTEDEELDDDELIASLRKTY